MQRKISVQFYRKFEKSWLKLKTELGREPSQEEIAQEVGIKQDDYKLQDCIQLITQDDTSEIVDEKFQIEYRQGISNYEFKKARIKAGYTQEQIDELLEIPKTTTGRIENFRVSPSEWYIEKISNLFGYDAHKLFPEWTNFIVENRNSTRSIMIVEIGRLALNNPEILALEAPDVVDNMSKTVDSSILKERLRPLLDELPPRELKILEMRYGLVDGVSHSLEEVGQEFGVTRERIKQISEKAMYKLKELAEERGINLLDLSHYEA